MSLAEALVALAARTLPERLRARYREEWLADVRGAGELGIPRFAVVVGALRISARLDRSDPTVTGIPLGVETIRRARWSAAFLVGALVIAFGALVDWRGGPPHLRADGGAALALVAGFALLGIATGIGAVRVGLRAHGTAWVARMALLGSIAVLAVALLAALPVFGFLPALGAMTTVLMLAAGGPRGRLPRPPLPAGARAALSVLLALLVVGTVAVGVLHILVWQPLARIPGMSLREIHEAMSAAGQPTGVEPVAVWAGLLIAAATACAVFCALGGFSGPRSTRRVVVAGTMLVATAASTVGIAGFTAGMSLADTFAIIGRHDAPSGALLEVVAIVATTGAVFAALVPVRRRAPAIAEDEARGALRAR